MAARSGNESSLYDWFDALDEEYQRLSPDERLVLLHRTLKKAIMAFECALDENAGGLVEQEQLAVSLAWLEEALTELEKKPTGAFA